MDSKKNISNGDIEFGELLMAFIRKWYWFVLFGVVGILAGMFIAQSLKLRHRVQSVVLIEDNSNQTVVRGNDVPIFDLNYRTKDLESEIAIFASKDLMEQAVLRTNAHLTLFKGTDLSEEIFQTQTPLKIHAAPPLGERYKDVPITLHILDEANYSVSYTLPSGSEEHSIAFGQEIDLLGSSFSIEKKPSFTEGNINEQYTLFLNSFDGMVSQFRRNLNVVEANKNTDGILLEIEEHVPARALALQNALIESYLMGMELERKKTAEDAFQFIEGRLELNFEDLDSLEGMITSYKQNSSIALPEKQIEILFEGIKEFKTELSDAQSQLDVIDRLLENIDGDVDDISLPNSVLGVSDPALNNLLIQLNELKAKREKMRQTVHPNNPLFKQVESEIGEMKRSLKADMLNFRDNMRVYVRDIESRIANNELEIEMIGGNNRVLDGLERRRSIMEELYNYLLQRREQAAMVAAAELVDSWVIEKPHVQESFHKPKKSMVIIFSTLLALMIPLGFVGYGALFKKKIQSVSEARKYSSIPLIGTIQKSKNAGSEVFANNDVSLQDFKTLYLNLNFSEQKDQIVMFSSSAENDGKTHCALNYASTLASLGRKTCLVELDLRRPSISNRLEMDEQAGILDVLSGTHSLKEVTRHTAFSSDLKLITAGNFQGEPLKFLMSDRFKELISALRSEYDHIVFDTPPSSMQSDLLLISKQADLNLFVVRQNKTTLTELGTLEAWYNSKQIANMALLYNGNTKQDGYYGSLAS